MTTMTDSQLDHWPDLLAQAGAQRRPIPLPQALAHATPDEGRAVQARCVQRVLQRIGGEVAGTKLGGTTQAALQALGLPGPFTGPIFSARIHGPGAVLKRADFLACIVEAEVAVRLGRDLDGTGELARADLLRAIDAMFPAIEIADSRYEGWAQGSAGAIYADLGYAGAWVRGQPYSRWRELDLPALAVTLSLDGQVVRQGSGANVLGDPLHALALAAPELARQGRALRAGDVVSLGSCTAPLPHPGAGRFVADFGPLGTVSVTLVG